jgi:hypothetical protein
MKTIITYECEICEEQSSDMNEIKECEARGKPDFEKYPVGMIFCNARSGNYKDITFAITRTCANGHFAAASWWACRDNGAGDNAGKGAPLCGDSIFRIHYYGIPDPDHSTFKRMVKVLKKEGIPITCWDGEKAISLKEFLKKNKKH